MTGNAFNPFFFHQEGGTDHGDVCPKSTPLSPAGRASARPDAAPEIPGPLALEELTASVGQIGIIKPIVCQQGHFGSLNASIEKRNDTN
jgi:hypothetical protein